MAWYKRNYFKFLVWLVVLIFVSIIVTLQLFFGLIFYIFYNLFFLKNYIKLKFNFNNLENIKFNNSKIKIKNITLIFFKFFIFDLPKKHAFLFFYNTVKFFYLSKNKLTIFKIFKHYKLIFSVLKKYFFSYLFILITGFSLIFVKNTNFVYFKFLSIFDSNWNFFIDFYSSFIFNLMLDYNSIQNKISDKKVIFNKKEKKIEVNPNKVLETLKKTKNLIIDELQNITEYNIAMNDVKLSSNIFIGSYNTSKPGIICSLNLDDEINLNSFSIQNELANPTEFQNNIKNTYIIQSQPALERINKNNLHKISGYSENQDFPNYIDKRILILENSELKSLIDNDINNNFRIPIHIVKKINKNIIDATKLIQNFDKFSDLKNNFVNDLVLYWNYPLIEYSLNENNNLVFNKIKCNLGEYLLQNKHNYSLGLSNTIEQVDEFFEKNKNVISELSFEEFEFFLKDYNIPDNNFIKTVHRFTEKFEKKGPYLGDVNEALDMDVFVNKLVEKLKELQSR